MRLQNLLLIGCCLLAGCAVSPEPAVPALRLAADNSSRQAVAAATAGRWESAAQAWREALSAYQSIDDWGGQGRARLGLSQALSRLGHSGPSQNVIAGVPEQALFPGVIRTRAAYQQALLLLSADMQAAWQRLSLARSLCADECALSVQFDNLGARLSMLRGDLREAQRLAALALQQAEDLPAERAHANRLLAELALRDGAINPARTYLESALKDDRLLAEPQWLLDDYLLQEKLAKALGDDRLLEDAISRQKSLCAGGLWAGCEGVAASKS